MYFSLHLLKKDEQNIIHRGKLLKEVVAKSELNVVQLVQRMKFRSRNTYYNHTKDPVLPVKTLMRYGKVLRYDFSQDISGMDKLVLEDGFAPYLPAPFDLEDATEQRDYYHRLYNELLEKVRRLESENAGLKKLQTDKPVLKKN